MTANTLPGSAVTTLGGFLRDRRARLTPDPSATGRRRTPGLRREEVAARAGVSVTWYTWLEQGRGGPPSDEVLERLARALDLDAPAREVLFLLAQNRPPPLSPAPTSDVPPALQRVLDAMTISPAIVKTPAWDIVAWNAAATAVLGDYASVPARERNLLRRMFTDPAARAHVTDWEENARFALGVLRVDVARGGGHAAAEALIAELLETSSEFRRLWAENEVRSQGFGMKRFMGPDGQALALETSSFPVEGADGLTMIVFTPLTEADLRFVADRIAEAAARAA
jgi:transcriptional regulator with XRE-family HTH domain